MVVVAPEDEGIEPVIKEITYRPLKCSLLNNHIERKNLLTVPLTSPAVHIHLKSLSKGLYLVLNI